MVERITSRRLTLWTLPALRGSNLPRPQAQRMCCGVHTESSADRSEMGQIDRSRRRRGCAGALPHKICTASLDNRPLIDGFVRAEFPHRAVPLVWHFEPPDPQWVELGIHGLISWGRNWNRKVREMCSSSSQKRPEPAADAWPRRKLARRIALVQGRVEPGRMA